MCRFKKERKYKLKKERDKNNSCFTAKSKILTFISTSSKCRRKWEIKFHVFHPKNSRTKQLLGQLLCNLPKSQQMHGPEEFQCRSSISYVQQTLSLLANNFTQYLNKILKPGEPKKFCQLNPSILHSFLQCPNLHVRFRCLKL